MLVFYGLSRGHEGYIHITGHAVHVVLIDFTPHTGSLAVLRLCPRPVVFLCPYVELPAVDLNRTRETAMMLVGSCYK